LLAVQVADCLPILLVDPRRRVVAAVHAGWRGTAQRLAEKTVGRMQLEFGCDPRRLRAAIGPGIHGCCYEVGRAVEEAFAGQFPYWEKLIRRVKPSPSQVHWQQRLFSPRPSAERGPRPALTAPEAEKRYLDLVEANRRQLLAAGVTRRNIWESPHCTACRTDLFFSHRAEHGHTGRMMGLIGLRA
jgi:YfiH family protein